MQIIDYCEFYITNVCNLACPGCNRFNNYKFTGLQRWDDYKDVYERWSKEIRFRSLGVLGGEPLLNPDIINWIIGLKTFWPNTPIKVVTNGYHLNKVRGLYDVLKTNPKVQLWIGIHNKMHKKDVMDLIGQFLTAPLKYEFNGNNQYQEYMWITDANGVKVRVEYNWWFHQGALIKQGTGFTLHNSDADIAHTNCHMKTCHHMIRGKLYKCGVVALLPEFAQQHKIELTEYDNELMNQYQPLSIDDTITRKQEFINTLPNSIEQCKFCPEVYKGDQIFALEKKDL